SAKRIFDACPAFCQPRAGSTGDHAMRRHLLSLIVSTSMLAAGSAFAAEASSSSQSTTGAPDTSSSTSSSTPTTTTTTKPGHETHAGVIKSFDEDTHVLVLKDGMRFMLDPSLKGEDLDRNKAVSLTYKMEGDNKIVTEYKVANKG